MTTLKKAVTLATALIVGATSLAMAQGAGGTNGNNGMPPQSYKGPGAMPDYSSSQFQSPGNASNNMPPKSYKGPGAMPSYSSSQYR